MAYRTSFNPSTRDLYFNNNGFDNQSGFTPDNLVSSPDRAIEIINAFAVPPSLFSQASINASETGVSFNGIVIPDSVSSNCDLWAIFTTDAIAVTLGSSQTARYGAVVNLGDSGICTLIDSEFNVVSVDNTMDVGSNGVTLTQMGAMAASTGNIGVKVTGACGNLFIDRRIVLLSGEGAIGFFHDATTETPATYMIEAALYQNIDQVLFHFDTATDQQAEVHIVSSRISDVAVVPNTGSKTFDISGTVVSATGGTIEAETLATISNEGTLLLTANGALGDLILETEGDAVLNLGFMVGDITVGVGSTLTAIIPIHFGTIINNGTINGIINGVRHGNWVIAAEDVTYDNTASGLIADDVQEALDELEAGIDQENIVYVSKVGDDTDSGLNPSHAKLTISSAVDAAIAMTPTAVNQIVVTVIDGAEYEENVTLPSFVHLNAAYASFLGRMTVNDDCVVRVRRAGNTNDTQPVFRKTSGIGKAAISTVRLDVSGSSQQGVRVDAGTISFTCTIALINAGVGLLARGGSEIAFGVGEVILFNGGTGLGTRTSGGDPNTFIGTVFRASDDGTGILIEANVSGDNINIQGGVYEVDTLYDLKANTTLNAFANSATGTRTADATATVNITNHSQETSHAGLIQSRTGLLGSYFGETLTLTSTTHTVTTESEIFVDADAAGGDVTITLPLSATRFISAANAGQKLTIKNISPTNTFNVNVNTTGSDNIEDKTTALIRASASIVIDPDGVVDWWIVGGIDPHKVILIAASFVDQEPTLIDTPLQIEFGAAQGTASDPVSLAADGTITFNEDGFFNVTVGVQYGRANVNLVAIIHFRLLLNGVQVNNSATAVLSTDTEDVPFSSTFGGTVTAGDEFTFEIIRDSTGTNDGGLFTKTVTAVDWADSPSASIRVSR